MTGGQRAIVVSGSLLVALYVLMKGRTLTPRVTTTETYDLTPYGLGNYPEEIKRFGRAVAFAEGFGIPNTIPTRANNPGDLKLSDGRPTLGEGITVFESPEQGWNALYKQLMLIVRGQSSYYSLDSTIGSMGTAWAAGDSAWAVNVSNHLGVTPDTPLWAVLV